MHMPLWVEVIFCYIKALLFISVSKSVLCGSFLGEKDLNRYVYGKIVTLVIFTLFHLSKCGVNPLSFESDR